jgi:serine/threonine protein kinase
MMKSKISLKRTKKKNQNGGKKLGQGSYGCVISPPLKCKNSQLLRNNKFDINNDYTSKIIQTKYSDVAFSELNIGIKLYNLDKSYKYFIPFINACYFKPQKHPDIIYLSPDGKNISYDPDSLDEYSDIKKYSEIKSDISSRIIKEHKTKCVLKKNLDYLNLIGPIAGNTLSHLLMSSKTNNENLFIKHNYWYIFTYLIKGLNIMHNNRIVHKDIKPSNLIIDFEYDTKSNIELDDSKSYLENVINCKLRYIDFGLAIILNKRKYNINDIILLLSNGTMYYTPLDIFGIKILYKLIKRGYDPHDKDFLYNMMTKMIHTYQKNREYYHYEGIRNNYLKLEDTSHHIHKKENISNYYLTPVKYEKIFKYIIDLYKTNKLESKITNLLYAWDVYSVGIVFSKIIVKNNINDENFTNLILKMIEINPENRITVNELIKDNNYKEHLSKVINLNY